jgi:hypothetical protein
VWLRGRGGLESQSFWPSLLLKKVVGCYFESAMFVQRQTYRGLKCKDDAVYYREGTKQSTTGPTQNVR